MNEHEFTGLTLILINLLKFDSGFVIIYAYYSNWKMVLEQILKAHDWIILNS